MARTVCRGCESKNLEEFLDLGQMPLAGGFLANKEAIAREKTFPLPVHVCRDCSLVQITEVVDPNLLFQEYSFSSSTIAPLVKHFEQYADWIHDKFKPNLVVEFGCNDGILLAPLEKHGIKTFGVDVSENITEIAAKRGLNVMAGFFNTQTAGEIEKRFGKADVVTGSNAFAHNDKPEYIIEGARSILNNDGHLCLEVMYAGDLLETYQWDTLYHEHLTFYSLGTLTTLLSRFGFTVVEAERLPMHGGSLRVAATLKDGAVAKPSVAAVQKYEQEKALNNPDTWHNFGKFIDGKIRVVKDTFARLSKNSRIWGYGAAGKATMWVNAAEMNYLEGMIDASPLRAGKLMPGTHTPIVFPDELKKNPPDYIFVTAWNYADLIRSKEEWFKGIWSTPLPDLRFF